MLVFEKEGADSARKEDNHCIYNKYFDTIAQFFDLSKYGTTISCTFSIETFCQGWSFKIIEVFPLWREITRKIQSSHPNI